MLYFYVLIHFWWIQLIFWNISWLLFLNYCLLRSRWDIFMFRTLTIRVIFFSSLGCRSLPVDPILIIAYDPTFKECNARFNQEILWPFLRMHIEFYFNSGLEYIHEIINWTFTGKFFISDVIEKYIYIYIYIWNATRWTGLHIV